VRAAANALPWIGSIRHAELLGGLLGEHHQAAHPGG
jgi:hypothetical protein